MASTLGKNLKRIRKRCGLSQQEIADFLCLHQTAICRIEQNIQELSANELYALSRMLKVDMNEFFEGVKF